MLRLFLRETEIDFSNIVVDIAIVIVMLVVAIDKSSALYLACSNLHYHLS